VGPCAGLPTDIKFEHFTEPFCALFCGGHLRAVCMPGTFGPAQSQHFEPFTSLPLLACLLVSLQPAASRLKSHTAHRIWWMNMHQIIIYY
jgi:hypothetical protein